VAEVRWSVDALRDLNAAGEYTQRWSADLARRLARRITESIEALAEFPQLGRVVPEFGQPDLRELIFQNYRIVYRLVESDVTVLAVLHSSMDITSSAERRGWEIS
jgi:plasmid stabilization system protein ParE